MKKIYDMIQNEEVKTGDFVLLTKEGDCVVSNCPSMVDSTLTVHIGFNIIDCDDLNAKLENAYENAKLCHKKYFPLHYRDM